MKRIVRKVCVVTVATLFCFGSAIHSQTQKKSNLTPTRPAERSQQEPFISYGGARISVGMTIGEVKRALSQANRHIEQDSSSGNIWIVSPNGSNILGEDGQITFNKDPEPHVVFASYNLPDVKTAEELAKEIAFAVDSMDSKVCVASNFSARGTGGGHSDTVFECGLQRFEVSTGYILGAFSSIRPTNVSIRIGDPVVK